MKTSNIIILSTIGLIISLNLWMVSDAKNKFENMIQETKTENTMPNVKTVDLANFSHIVISDQIHLDIETSKKNSISSSNKEKYQTQIINDTLYISGNTFVSIKCNTIKSIELKNECKLNTENLQTDYLLIKSLDDSKVILRNTSINKLEIYSKNDSRIILTQSKIDTTNILASENSRIGITGTLNIVRGEAKDNSNLSVTGANNTQFSKSDNASINMR